MEEVIRSIGNRGNTARLRSDSQLMTTYRPRGTVITSGEQLPGGLSRNARLLVVDFDHRDIDRDSLTLAQKEASSYRHAYTGYVKYILKNWNSLKDQLPNLREEWRERAQFKDGHLRLATAVATLYAGLDTGISFAEELGVLSSAQAQERRDEGWNAFMYIADKHAATVAGESPGRKFIDAFCSLRNQGKLAFVVRGQDVVPSQKSGVEWNGWEDETHYYLNPRVAYNEVKKCLDQSGESFTATPKAVWSDLALLSFSNPQDNEQCKTRIRNGEKVIWTIPLIKERLLSDDGNS